MNHISKAFLTGVLAIISLTSEAKLQVKRIDPAFWFVGMNNPKLQLLINGTEFHSPEVTCNQSAIQIEQVTLMPNNQFLIVDVLLSSELKPGEAQFTINDKGGKTKFTYTFKEKKKHTPQRLTAADNMYLLMPDRFANGEPKNDVVKDMNQNTIDRSEVYERHGGDLQGVVAHLPYLKNLGVTALWLNPVYENNQHHESYHGYAITDHYQVDPRFGGNEWYAALADSLHDNNMKLVKDVVFNHFGDQHYLIKNLPSTDWINQWEVFTQSNFRAPTIFDPYAADTDRKKFQNGWFDHHMPDINQQNPYVANYLIQNSIWWIATYGIDAYRIDTYAYSDQQFMANWATAILKEFPHFFMFGETWVHGNTIQSYFVEQASTPRPFASNLESVTDFQLYYALTKMATEPFGWTNGVASVYYTLAQDIIYEHPENLVTFLDNHDLGRFYGVAGKDLQKFKAGYGMLFTLRGIPQILYGSEILMGETENHGKIREDFWGGWSADTVNKFDTSGRTLTENEAHDYLQRLMNWRKTAPAIVDGELVHYIPEDGMYVYFRTAKDGSQKVMVMVNANENSQTIHLNRFTEEVFAGQKAFDWAANELFIIPDSLDFAPFDIKILELE